MSYTGDSIRKLRRNLSRLETDDKFLVGIYFVCLAGMAGAVISHFGWSGALFLVSALVWKASDAALRRPMR